MKEKNIDRLQRETLRLKRIKLILTILILPSFIVVGAVAPYSSSIAGFLLILSIINIIVVNKLKEKIYKKRAQIYQMDVITKAIEDSKM